MSAEQYLHEVKNDNPEDAKGLEMPLETKRLIISFLNDYLPDPGETSEQHDPHLREIVDFEKAVLGEILEDGKIPEDTPMEKVIEVYRKVFKKMPKEMQFKEWDPMDKNDPEVAKMLMQRFYLPRHTEEKNENDDAPTEKGRDFEMDVKRENPIHPAEW